MLICVYCAYYEVFAVQQAPTTWISMPGYALDLDRVATSDVYDWASAALNKDTAHF